MSKRRGFTLLEIAFVVVVVAVLAMVAIPQYKHAVLKSRYSALLPVAQHLKTAQEAYYTGNSYYSDDLSTLDLDVPGTITSATTATYGDNMSAKISTQEDEEEEYSYVLASKEGLNNNYIMYQEYSKNYPGEIHCEAKNGDSYAQWLCEKGLSGQKIEKGSITPGYTTYVLSGTGNGTFLKECTAEKELEDTSCACGKRTRTTSGCNEKTGEWEYGEWSSCPVKPEESKPCSQLDPKWTSGTATRTSQCENNSWTEPAWDDSACEMSCTKEKVATVACEGCGTKTAQSVTCDTKTGEWVYDNWTSCPEKPSEEENCSTGVNAKMTRTVTCQDNAWTEPAWDKHLCCNPENKPNNTRSCKDNYNADTCGLEVQQYTCSTSGVWTALEEWDHSACTPAPNTDTVACDSPFTYGTKTSSYSCVEDEWQESWDTEACGYTCQGDTPTQPLTCPLGCGKYTGTASCNYETGLWGTEYTGDPSGCPAKPDDETNTCYSSGTVRTRSATCNAAGTEWSGWSDWSSVCNNWRCTSSVKDACAYASYVSNTSNSGIKGCTGEGAEVCSYSTFRGYSTGHAYCTANATDACSYSTFIKENSAVVYCSATAAYGCRGSTFKGGAHCEGNVENACRGITLKTGSYCHASGAKACQGVTIPSGSYCYGSIAEGCSGAVIQSGGECRANVKDGCKGATFRSGSCCRGTAKNCPSGVTLCS